MHVCLAGHQAFAQSLVGQEVPPNSLSPPCSIEAGLRLSYPVTRRLLHACVPSRLQFFNVEVTMTSSLSATRRVPRAGGCACGRLL